MEKMSREELRKRIEKRLGSYNKAPRDFFMTWALVIFESVEPDNPLKMEALRFMAEVHGGRYV